MRLLVEALTDIRGTARLDTTAWNELLLQARHQRLLARLGLELRAAGLEAAIPSAARRQIAAACTAAEANRLALTFEIERVQAVLCSRGIPVVLLKGGAYAAAGLPAARGRSATDLDILVPREGLALVEELLRGAGWSLKEVSDYDDRYYREWMHELPPFWHAEREMVLDVHHTIFPPVSGVRISGEALLAAARPLGGGLLVLQPCDMVLHAALHLFGEDTWDRLRDLLDIRDLVEFHCRDRPGFGEELVARAEQLGLGWALDHAFHHLRTLLRMEIPPAAARIARRGLRRQALDRLIGASLPGGMEGLPGAHSGVLRLATYMRSHWIRMPPLRLLHHLATKAMQRRSAAEQERRG